MNIAHKVREMRRDLIAAQLKLEHFKRPPVDVKSLRKAAARFCHPDCGGDVAVMQQLNALFDFVGGR